MMPGLPRRSRERVRGQSCRGRRLARLGAEALEARALLAAGVLADYDGDGRSDLGVFAFDGAKGLGVFAVDRSSLGPLEVGFGGADDRPVVGDYDGDGRDDLAVYGFSPLDGFSRFGILPSGGGSAQLRPFGGEADLPVGGDYDGDGVTDLAVFGFSPDNGFARFAAILSGGGNAEFPDGVVTLGFGGAGDVSIVGDFDGDGKSDFGVYGPSAEGTFNRFAIRLSGGPNAAYPTGSIAFAFGGLGDVPSVGDYDGDGRDDLAVAGFSPLEGFRRFAILPSSGGPGRSVPFGGFEDLPVPLDTDGDGTTDLAVYGFSPVEGFSRFAVLASATTGGAVSVPLGGPGGVALPPPVVAPATPVDPDPNPDPDPDPDPDRPPFRIDWVNRGTASDQFSEAERAVIDRAIDLWEGLIVDNNRPGNTLRVTFEGGQFSGLDMGDTLGLSTVRFDATGTTEATIELDADGGGPGWYVDPNPMDDAEYAVAASPTYLIGGPPGQYDFLSTVIHELGHALGFGIGFGDNVPERFSPLPGGGGAVLYQGPGGVSAVLTAGRDHLDPAFHAYDLLAPEAFVGTRTLPTELDLLLLADVYGYAVALPAAPPDTRGPQVVDAMLAFVGGGGQVVAVAFDEAIGVVGLDDPGHYGLLRPQGDGFAAVPSPFASASFDVATLRLELRLRDGLQVGPGWQVVIPGLGANALADLAGNLLDGDLDGSPGGDAVLPIRA